MDDLVWYACYGSNLLKERFMKYINGGVAPGASFSQVGCEDKEPPIKDSRILLNHQLYFAHRIEGWEGHGVAFIEQKENNCVKTLGRMYLIKKKQFEQIVLQENNVNKFVGHPIIEFEKIIDKGSIVMEEYLYGKIIFLGRQDNYPIFTFTAKWNDNEISYNRPGGKYIKVIADGLRESYLMTDEELYNYFVGLPGIEGNISFAELKRVVGSDF